MKEIDVMKFVLALLSFTSSLVYGYYLLKFINASSFLWVLWIVTWIFTFLYALASVLAKE